MRFKAPPVTPPGLFRRMPPAAFPPLMGLFALGLGLRRASAESALPGALGEAFLGAVSLLFLFTFGALLIKLARRPAVLAEDLRLLPGRAGVAASVLCLYLLALALAPYLWVRPLILVTLALNIGFIALVVWVLATGPAEQRRVTPVWHLSFVGPIIGALAFAMTGDGALARLLLALTLPVAAVVWAVSALQLARATVPPPLRPLLAIHLAPVALLGMVAGMTGFGSLATAALWLSVAGLAALVASVRWLTVAGFSPLWGAFTFPLAATANLWLAMGWHRAGSLLLVAALFVVIPIAFRIFKMWAQGRLQVLTNAAIA